MDQERRRRRGIRRQRDNCEKFVRSSGKDVSSFCSPASWEKRFPSQFHHSSWQKKGDLVVVSGRRPQRMPRTILALSRNGEKKRRKVITTTPGDAAENTRVSKCAFQKRRGKRDASLTKISSAKYLRSTL